MRLSHLDYPKDAPEAEVAVAIVCWTNHPSYGLAFGRISESTVMQLAEYTNAEGMEDE